MAGTAPTTQEEVAEATQRLGLPELHMLTVEQAKEVYVCIGCRAHMSGGIRIVHVVPDCPYHTTR